MIIKSNYTSPLNNFSTFFKGKVIGGNADGVVIDNNDGSVTKVFKPQKKLTALNEIKVLRYLESKNYKNCPKIIEVKEYGNSIHIKMTRIKGITLSKYIKNKTQKEIKEIESLVLDRLKTLHSLNVIHGDLSGANIMLELENNKVKDIYFIDFAASKIEENGNKSIDFSRIGFDLALALSKTQ